MMTALAFASGTDAAQVSSDNYEPGVCNIGPAEIARRRMAGHVGLMLTLGVMAVLIALDLHPLTRLIVILPAAASASGYLQAWLKFCAGFGARGIFNFGRVGEATAVPDDAARDRDRRRSRQMSMWALPIGLAVGIVAVILPL
jgi:hypothetical protein